MKLTKILTLALVPCLALLLEPALKAAPEEAPQDSLVQNQAPQLLSTLNVTSLVQPFELALPNCGKNLHSVEIKVIGGDVNLIGFGLHFSDKRTLNFPKSQFYKAGTDSGWINLTPFQHVPGLCPTAIFAEANSPSAATVLIYGTLQ